MPGPRVYAAARLTPFDFFVTRLPAVAALLCGLAFAPAVQCAPAAGLAPLEALPLHVVPAPAIPKTLTEPPRKDRPYRFAIGLPADLSLADGTWEQADATTSVWRLRLAAPGAQSLSLRLAPLVVPAGGSVTLYDPARQAAPRPYTAADNPRLGTHAPAWTPMVPGDALVLEARVPTGTESALKLGIVEAYYGYRDWRKADATDALPKNGGDAGACNVNVACPAGDVWADDARAVALITIANQFVCTGQLVNNVRQDRTPLFLTANHCGIGTGDGDVGDASSVNFYFGYQAVACSVPARPRPPVADVQGSTFLADDIQSDFTLLRLNVSGSNRLPADAYFSGWSAMGAGASSGASIHHPSGDEKKISLFSTALEQTAADIGQMCPVDTWQVQWTQGTTEPGSSGAGLWTRGTDGVHHLIGTLSGGNASCENRSGADYFGRLDRGWTANPNRDGQLKAHLDPDGTCIAEIPGIEAQGGSPGPITTGPTRCEGRMSDCSQGGGGGGALAPSLLLLLLARAGIGLRRRQSQTTSHTPRTATIDPVS
jgi:lysyl endopeptidase